MKNLWIVMMAIMLILAGHSVFNAHLAISAKTRLADITLFASLDLTIKVLVYVKIALQARCVLSLFLATVLSVMWSRAPMGHMPQWVARSAKSVNLVMTAPRTPIGSRQEWRVVMALSKKVEEKNV